MGSMEFLWDWFDGKFAIFFTFLLCQVPNTKYSQNGNFYPSSISLGFLWEIFRNCCGILSIYEDFMRKPESVALRANQSFALKF